MALAPGTTLLIATDGLVERRDENLTEGITRLCAAAAFDGPLGDQLDHILTLLGHDAHDDIALLGSRWGQHKP